MDALASDVCARLNQSFLVSCRTTREPPSSDGLLNALTTKVGHKGRVYHWHEVRYWTAHQKALSHLQGETGTGGQGCRV